MQAQLDNMVTIIRDTPSWFIPKELFREEKIQEYWSVLHTTSQVEEIGKDEVENFILLYPKPKDVHTVHEISLMYKDLREKFPENHHAVYVNVYDECFNLLLLKDADIAYSGYFRFSVKEDVLYHIANVAQKVFEDISQVTFAYKQAPPAIIYLLNDYYDMKKI